MTSPGSPLPRGLSAFPLTPLHDDALDTGAYAGLVARLAAAGVDSITALGSTGSYAYLSRPERALATRVAVEHAGDVPVLVGVGALRTRHVLELVEDAQEAGAAGVLLAPMTYQPLTPDDVVGLYEDVTAHLSVPLVVYDNPGTTRFAFTDELYGAVAALPHVASVKIPALPAQAEQARERVAAIRRHLPAHVSLGISGDAGAAAGLLAGCDLWYSVVGGTLPGLALALTRAAVTGDGAEALAEQVRLAPLWELFARFGSLRTTAVVAEELGLAQRSCLPLPLRGLDDAARAEVAAVLDRLDLRA
ncbi:dihydrodipicolinate synthase family protein [Kineococcus rubinsiae]|uniref:dihydrodipicolinate synthase family protein n=1 Tax=Kineococcus rubinsiae TaxID=2609562 RepID=UPI0027E4F301|nr:dihydrodipicolinate synthase family protein [Kineococcus rubinsiae]